MLRARVRTLNKLDFTDRLEVRVIRGVGEEEKEKVDVIILRGKEEMLSTSAGSSKLIVSQLDHFHHILLIFP